jgi:hypothetical protein
MIRPAAGALFFKQRHELIARQRCALKPWLNQPESRFFHGDGRLSTSERRDGAQRRRENDNAGRG